MRLSAVRRRMPVPVRLHGNRRRRMTRCSSTSAGLNHLRLLLAFLESRLCVTAFYVESVTSTNALWPLAPRSFDLIRLLIQ
jgi:hypothetical protein